MKLENKVIFTHNSGALLPLHLLSDWGALFAPRRPENASQVGRTWPAPCPRSSGKCGQQGAGSVSV